MKKLTPIKSIRAKCKDCSLNQLAVIRKCQITQCPLHPYRMGRRPKEEPSRLKRKRQRKVFKGK